MATDRRRPDRGRRSPRGARWAGIRLAALLTALAAAMGCAESRQGAPAPAASPIYSDALWPGLSSVRCPDGSLASQFSECPRPAVPPATPKPAPPATSPIAPGLPPGTGGR